MSTALCILIGIAFVLVGTFFFLAYRVYKIKSKNGPLTFVILGMLIGAVIGFFTSFNMDDTKGWNPYGWWFIATFLLTIAGGLVGLIVFSIASKKSRH